MLFKSPFLQIIIKIPFTFSQYIFKYIFSRYFGHLCGFNGDEIDFVAKMKGLAVNSDCRKPFSFFFFFNEVQIDSHNVTISVHTASFQ